MNRIIWKSISTAGRAILHTVRVPSKPASLLVVRWNRSPTASARFIVRASIGFGVIGWLQNPQRPRIGSVSALHDWQNRIIFCAQSRGTDSGHDLGVKSFFAAHSSPAAFLFGGLPMFVLADCLGDMLRGNCLVEASFWPYVLVPDQYRALRVA